MHEWDQNESQIVAVASSLNWNVHEMAAVELQDRLRVSSFATVEKRSGHVQSPNETPGNMPLDEEPCFWLGEPREEPLI